MSLSPRKSPRLGALAYSNTSILRRELQEESDLLAQLCKLTWKEHMAHLQMCQKDLRVSVYLLILTLAETEAVSTLDGTIWWSPRNWCESRGAGKRNVLGTSLGKFPIEKW